MTNKLGRKRMTCLISVLTLALVLTSCTKKPVDTTGLSNSKAVTTSASKDTSKDDSTVAKRTADITIKAVQSAAAATTTTPSTTSPTGTTVSQSGTSGAGKSSKGSSTTTTSGGGTSSGSGSSSGSSATVTPPSGYTGGLTLNSSLTSQFNGIVHENKYTGANYSVLHGDLVAVALGNMTDSQFTAKHFVPGTETGGWTENPDGSPSKFFTHDYKITRYSSTSGDANTIYQQARANGLFVSVDTIQTYTPFLYAETVIVYNPNTKCNIAVRLIMSVDRLFL